jgi:hypothetical protein
VVDGGGGGNHGGSGGGDDGTQGRNSTDAHHTSKSIKT